MKSLARRKNLLASLREIRRSARGHRTKSNKESIDCKNCKSKITKVEFEENYGVCPHCGEHHTIRGVERLNFLMDKGYRILNLKTKHLNPIDFPNYEKKLEEVREKTGLKEAVIVATGKIEKNKVCVAILEPRFFMGSMGSYVGEEITKAFEYAMRKKMPMLVVAASGGARMQEGMFSLMQMAKTSAVVKKFSDRGLLYICLLTHPTTGGVSASFASLGDIMMAEPNSLIGFAGPRVIEQTIKQKLPDDFQRAEKLVECGFVDMIVERKKQRETIGRILHLHNRK